MKTLFASLTLLLALLAAGHSAACTDNRPTGQAGNSGTAITGIIGTGTSSVRVIHRHLVFGSVSYTDIPFGADSGIVSTFGSGHAGTTMANRVVSLASRNTSGAFYWQINGSFSKEVEFTGPGISGVIAAPQPMVWRGAGGMLQSIRGGTTPSWTTPGETLGRFEFSGIDNGSAVSGAAYLISAAACDPPVALRAYERRVMLARSFLPELERVTRHWWMS